jgi:hypothetical protein
MVNGWAKGLAIITGIVISLVIVLICFNITGPSLYQGNIIKLNIYDSDLNISSESFDNLISIEGYSNHYFEFRSEDKTILYSIPLSTPPLSWVGENCFYLNKEITPGKWEGSSDHNIITLIKSKNDIIVTVTPNDKTGDIVAIWVLGFVVYILLFIFISLLDDKF